jgi:diketogulonate reductase-like aldo/keto reductase
MNTLSAQTIQHLMRKHHKTIRGIALEWNLTMKRVR